MHQPPTYTIWKITCRSPEDAQALRQWLISRIDLNRVITDATRSEPNGEEQSRIERHRLGDYFVAVDAPPATTALSLRLVFHRRPDAGRFWKDLMVNILQEVESAPQTVMVELDSKGEKQPDATPAVM